MRAGFAKTAITPPLGTPLAGFGARRRRWDRSGMSVELYLSSSAIQSTTEAVTSYASGHGYAGVEWYLDHRRIPISAGARGRLFAAMRRNGLGARFHAPAADVEIGHRDCLVAEASLGYLTMYLNHLSEMAPAVVTVHMGSRALPMEELSWERACDNLSRVVAAGRERGLTVCIENLKGGWTSDPSRLAEIAEASGASITFDLGHAGASRFARSGGTLEEFYGVIRGRVANAHVYALETPEGRHLPLEAGTGHRAVLDLLLADGLRTWVLELSSVEDLERTRHAMEHLASG